MQEFPAPLRRSLAAHGSGLTVLVLRLGAMGDIVRTLPAVRLLRFGLPDARVHWVAWEAWTPLLRGHAEIDEVVAIPRSEWRGMARAPGRWTDLAAAARGLVAALRAAAPGLVLDFHGDLRSGLLGRLSAAPVRLGYSGHQQKEGNRLFTTHRVPPGPRRRSRIDRNLELVRALGLPVDPMPDAGIPIGPVDERAAAGVLSASEVRSAYAVLNAGASRRQAYKKPPPGLLAEAARAAAGAGLVPLVVHGPGEEDDARAVVEASRGVARSAGATGLLALAALLRGARLFVGGDSGPLHLACGVGCPVVGLYGPTDPAVNAPWRVPSASVAPEGRAYTGIKARDRRSGGFEGIGEDEVARAVESVLAVPSIVEGLE
ncbi:MAG TPA: glycosyltransferase family 9 protein [Candidatus Polarisedimenticolaceae bacterium]|nr:glycosyltransferase family 9 protein [Candidatus Polarisedimenticolaceae bacterium]